MRPGRATKTFCGLIRRVDAMPRTCRRVTIDETSMNERGGKGTGPCVPAGVSCRNCGYDLRGWRDDARCPECGFEIAFSLVPLRTAIQSAPIVAGAIRGLSFATMSVFLCIVSFPVGGLMSDYGYPLIACISLVLLAAAMRSLALRALLRLHNHARAVVTHRNENVCTTWPLIVDVVLSIAMLAAAAADLFWVVAYGVPLSVVFGTAVLIVFVGRASVAFLNREATAFSRAALLYLLAGGFGLVLAVVLIELEIVTGIGSPIFLTLTTIVFLGGFVGVVKVCSGLRADLLSFQEFAGKKDDC